jgi:hypothetical protein
MSAVECRFVVGAHDRTHAGGPRKMWTIWTTVVVLALALSRLFFKGRRAHHHDGTG